MSAPPSDVVDRLERLAAHAPAGSVDPDDLWVRGRRRQQGQWAVVVAGCFALVVCVGGAVAAPVLRVVDTQMAVAPDGAPRVLPGVFRTPGKWEPAFPTAPGPLVAVGSAPRGGWVRDTSSLWGVSALTGESRFLDLPDAASGLAGAALDSTGTKLAYWIVDGPAGSVTADPQQFTVATGAAVLDLVTGEERRWDAGTVHGLGAERLIWAGDVLWLSGGAFADEDQDSFPATVWTWGPEGAPEPRLEPPLDIAGAAARGADGFLIERGATTTQVQVVDGAGAVSRVRLVHGGGMTSETSVSPDGRLIAGLRQERGASIAGSPLPLVVGEIAGARAEMTEVGDVEAPSIMGWRSPTEVVVASNALDEDGDRSSTVRDLSTVDVVDGTERHLVELGETGFTTYAARAWAGDVIDAPQPPFAPDPRQWSATGGVVLVLLLLVGWRWNRSRRGHP
jgi:hypothetical protein